MQQSKLEKQSLKFNPQAIHYIHVQDFVEKVKSLTLYAYTVVVHFKQDLNQKEVFFYNRREKVKLPENYEPKDGMLFLFFDMAYENIPFLDFSEIKKASLRFIDEHLEKIPLFIKKHYLEQKNQLSKTWDQYMNPTSENVKKFFAEWWADKNDGLQKALENERIKKLLGYVHQNLDKHLTLNELSGVVYYAPEYIGQWFSSKTGQNIKGYIAEAKIMHTFKKMVNSKQKLGEIASASGFSNQGYLTRTFNKYFGDSPKDLRNQYVHFYEACVFNWSKTLPSKA